MSDTTHTKAPKGKYRILIVDDNETMRLFFRDVFWIQGLNKEFEIVMADGVENAKEIIKDPKTRPHVVFLDMMMPIRPEDSQPDPYGGMEVLRFVREELKMKDLRVVIFSSYPDLKEEAKKIGADDYLVKGDHLPQDLVEYAKELVKELGKTHS